MAVAIRLLDLRPDRIRVFDDTAGMQRRSILVGAVAAVGAGIAAGPSWQARPAAASAPSITNTVEADLVIVGAGCAGVFTAHAAAEAGARVVVIEKMKGYSARGMFSGAINTIAHRRAGITIDTEKVIAELVASAGNRIHQGLVRQWAEKSGGVFDQIIEICEANGLQVVLLSELFNFSKQYPHLYPSYPTGHAFMTKEAVAGGRSVFEASQADLLALIERKATDAGAEFHYTMPAGQPVLDEGGRVTGVLAGGQDGSTAYHARKAVVLATGGYTENEEMLRTWCPAALDPELRTYTPAGGNTGDGFTMVGSQGPVAEASRLRDPLATPRFAHGGYPIIRENPPPPEALTLSPRRGNDPPLGIRSGRPAHDEQQRECGRGRLHDEFGEIDAVPRNDPGDHGPQGGTTG